MKNEPRNVRQYVLTNISNGILQFFSKDYAMAIQLIYRRFFRESEAKQSFRIVLTNRPKARISISMASHSALL